MENRFNLIDEPWIPVADHGRVSLRQIFSQPEYRSLGGNPVQKIALLKLLLAIAQSAATPDNEAEWKILGVQGLAERCLAYLDQWHDRFYLYGEQPFLQVPRVTALIDSRTALRVSNATSASKKKDAEESGLPRGFGAGFYPDMPSSNNTVLSHSLIEHELSNVEKAVFLVTIMNFAFGGKRVEADMISLGGRVLGNRYSAPAGPSMGGWTGYLHSFILTKSVLSDIWVNLLSKSDIESLKVWPRNVGKALWEEMPTSESDQRSKEYKESYLSTLIALSRFSQLSDDGIYYTDGLSYPSVKDGWYEPNIIVDRSGSDIKTKYVNPERRPWRELDGLLAFVGSDSVQGYECYALKKGVERARGRLSEFSVWAGGLKVSVNSGDQSVKQSDDFVESQIWLNSDEIGCIWFTQLKLEMDALDALANVLWKKVLAYFKELKADNGKKIENTHAGKMASQSVNLFWQLCERDFQALVDNCDQTDSATTQRQALRRRFSDYVQQSYDQFCPRETARQLDAWAKCRPNNSKYLKQEA